ncbi:MAG: hypothetical protein WBB82_08755 [Limnothrix sp.]
MDTKLTAMDNELTTPIPEDLKDKKVSSGEELVPAEVAARKEREGDINTNPEKTSGSDTKVADGYTVSGQGLINNHAVTPDMYVSDKSGSEKRKNYTMSLIIGIAILGAFAAVTALLKMVA